MAESPTLLLAHGKARDINRKGAKNARNLREMHSSLLSGRNFETGFCCAFAPTWLDYAARYQLSYGGAVFEGRA